MLTLTAVAWGGMFPILKPTIATTDPFTFNLLRFVGASVVFSILLLAVEGKSAFSMERNSLRLWINGSLGFAGFGLLLLIGLTHTSPEHAAVIPALMPLIAVVLTSLTSRSSPRPLVLIAICIGIAGVVLVVTKGQPGSLLAGNVGYGEALVLAGATCWVCYTLGAKRFMHWSALRYTTLTLVQGTVTIAIIEVAALVMGRAHLPAPSQLMATFPAITYMILAASVMGFMFWSAGMRHIGPARGVLFINLVPVTAFAIAVARGRPVSGWEVAGILLVLTAFFLNSFAPQSGAHSSRRQHVAQGG